jgi:hypothetical protein
VVEEGVNVKPPATEPETPVLGDQVYKVAGPKPVVTDTSGELFPAHSVVETALLASKTDRAGGGEVTNIE